MPKNGTGSSLRTMQAKAAAARRWNTPERETIERDYAAERIATYVQEIVDRAPPLTPDQRLRITGLLRGGGSRG